MATVIRVDSSGVRRLQILLAMVANPNATPLMQTWMEIIEEDNRKGVMAGTDRYGNAMPAVTYRPVGEPQKRLTDAQRNTSNRRLRRGDFVGRGGANAGNNNLTSAEYRKLDGPPLAPRGQFSRVITNLITGFTTPRSNNGVPGESAGKWQAVGYWEEVVSAKGVPFLMAHFTGAAVGRGHAVTLRVRDLRGVRPEGKRKARAAMREWMVSEIRVARQRAQTESLVAGSLQEFLANPGEANPIDLSIFNLNE
ncbi:MAG: hypothetical protein ACLP4V_10685 [Methylocella sp.]